MNIKDVPVVIIGNKNDLIEQRKIFEEEFASTRCGVHTFETSALTGDHVESAFYCLIYQVIKPCLDLNEMVKSELSQSGLKGKLV